MFTLIHHVRLVRPEGITDNGAVLIAGSRILYAGEDQAILSQTADEKIDGQGLFLSPGFVDIHFHGGGGSDFMDGTPEAFRTALSMHMKHGTTSCVPTTLCCQDDELNTVFAMARKFKDEAASDLPEVLGVHLEGPFISAEQAGAQDPQYIRGQIDDSYHKIMEMGEGVLLIWTVAPELAGAAEMCRDIRAHGIYFSAGHSSAKYADVDDVIAAGCTMATHLYSSMSTITRVEGLRTPGLLEASLLRDEIAAEVIGDGMHLPPELLRLIVKTKPLDKIILITDAMRGAGMPEGYYKLGSLAHGQTVHVYGGVARMPSGTSLAGSVATTDRLVRVMTRQAGVSLPDTIRMITQNPAEQIGLGDRKGSLKVGYDADLVLFDEDINVKGVWCRGIRTV